ncbi:hypothetical protein AB0M45_14590 [Nocardia sp. NPDC051787]|uniref:hypothetical protein n=1 Tax=Nocardia sp. NPDC051787 TaxID=3155415 RepID=UPI00341E33E3
MSGLTDFVLPPERGRELAPSIRTYRHLRGPPKYGRTKTDSGYRTVVLPQFVVDTLRRVKAEAVDNELGVVFPNRDGGIWDPHNFNRLWRHAQQLGHANDSVTKRHYIDQPTKAHDFTAALGRLAG